MVETDYALRYNTYEERTRTKTKGDAMQTKTNNMATVAKTQTKKKKKSIVSKENRKKIIVAYYQLYRAFLLKNLMSGMTLGAASHNALQLLQSKISTMDKANPVTKLLMRVHKHHSKRVAKRVMTSKYRDARAIVKPEQRAKLTATVMNLIRTSLGVFNSMSAQYKPKQKVKVAAKQQVAPKPVQQKQNMVLLIQVKQMNDMRQRAA